MATVPLPDRATLIQLLDYEPETGALRWRRRSSGWFASGGHGGAKAAAKAWNSRYAGTAALASPHTGYFAGHLLGRRVLAHRVIWKLIHDDEPEEVDHINHVRTDNRLVNLRGVDGEENRRNHPRRRDNTSGRTGVSWNARDRRWCASLQGRALGYFLTFEEAAKVREEAELAGGLHENHGTPA